MDTLGKGWIMSLIKWKIYIYEKGGAGDLQCYYCTVTILLICSKNQWGGFYVMLTLAWISKEEKWLK